MSIDLLSKDVCRETLVEEPLSSRLRPRTSAETCLSTLLCRQTFVGAPLFVALCGQTFVNSSLPTHRCQTFAHAPESTAPWHQVLVDRGEGADPRRLSTDLVGRPSPVPPCPAHLCRQALSSFVDRPHLQSVYLFCNLWLWFCRAGLSGTILQRLSGPDLRTVSSTIERMSRALLLWWMTFVALHICVHAVGFMQGSEAEYLAAWDEVIGDSYSMPLPTEVAHCRNRGVGDNPTDQVIAEGVTTSQQLQARCGPASVCVIPATASVDMTAPLDLAALVIRGTLTWTDSTQAQPTSWLCAGYVAVEGGHFRLQVSARTAYVYLKDNGATHPHLRTRAFGGVGPGSRIDVSGRPLARTWSLLSAPVPVGASELPLLHSPEDMGWRVGDRLVIAPTTAKLQGTAEAVFVGGFGPGNTIVLASGPGAAPRTATTGQAFAGSAFATAAGLGLRSAEVINVGRNVVVTGDDFRHVACDPHQTSSADGCTCSHTKCTMGLHTVMMGEGTVMRMQYARLERCGQRGVMAKYCLHLHRMGACPECLFRGNAVENGQQRGVVVHGTHLATVEHNVFTDVRGAHMYIEDGSEMYNRLLYNVAICPWPFQGPKGGCTVPGTDNPTADTADNQAGLWSNTNRNHIIGNRCANHFNGMLFEVNADGKRGRGFAKVYRCATSLLYTVALYRYFVPLLFNTAAVYHYSMASLCTIVQCCCCIFLLHTIIPSRWSIAPLHAVILRPYSLMFLWSVTPYRYSPPFLRIVTPYRHSVPSLCTGTLYRCSVPLLCTVALYRCSLGQSVHARPGAGPHRGQYLPRVLALRDVFLGRGVPPAHGPKPRARRARRGLGILRAPDGIGGGQWLELRIRQQR